MSDADRHVIAALAAGTIPSELPPSCEMAAELGALVTLLRDVREIALSLGRGDLRPPVTALGGPIVGSLKALHASLRHLTWQAQRVANGDLSHRVDFMGEFSEAFNDMVRQLAERRQLEAQLLQAQKLELLGHLARSFAHEINTPAQFANDSITFLTDAFTDLLALVERYRGALATLGNDPRAAGLLDAVREAERAADLEFIVEESGQACQAARDGIRRMSDMTHALEDFIGPDRASRDVADLNRGVVAVSTVARYHCQQWATIETDLGSVPPVACVVAEVNEALLALLLNAAEAIADVVTASGGIGRIVVHTRVEDGNAVIEVEDNGCGIPEEVRPRLFEASFTTRKREHRVGGLAMARAIIVDDHGGTLTCDSEVGVGTTFRITLPLRAA